MRVKLDPTANILLRKGVLPSLFNCQPDRRHAQDVPIRLSILKHDYSTPGTSQTTAVDINPQIECTKLTSSEIFIDTVNDDDLKHTKIADMMSKTKSIGIQVKLREHKMRSKFVQNVPKMKDACFADEQKIHSGANLPVHNEQSTTSTNITCSLDDTLNDCDDEYLLSEEISEEAKQNLFELTKLTRNIRIKIIENNPKRYLGIPDNAFFFIKHLSKESGVSMEEICLTITKIKLNQSFATLADDFGVSYTTASVTFRRTLSIIKQYLKQLIIWPSKRNQYNQIYQYHFEQDTATSNL